MYLVGRRTERDKYKPFCLDRKPRSDCCCKPQSFGAICCIARETGTLFKKKIKLQNISLFKISKQNRVSMWLEPFSGPWESPKQVRGPKGKDDQLPGGPLLSIPRL